MIDMVIDIQAITDQLVNPRARPERSAGYPKARASLSNQCSRRRLSFSSRALGRPGVGREAMPASPSRRNAAFQCRTLRRSMLMEHYLRSDQSPDERVHRQFDAPNEFNSGPTGRSAARPWGRKGNYWELTTIVATASVVALLLAATVPDDDVVLLLLLLLLPPPLLPPPPQAASASNPSNTEIRRSFLICFTTMSSSYSRTRAPLFKELGTHPPGHHFHQKSPGPAPCCRRSQAGG